eukprot:c8340_g1_i1.p1 GENE.c8340_g1_i1~~c8340_g1_i1.p1  ORF type:complete len:534 (-),score=115.90 c8340_g1_i1:3-1604(-)
MSLLSRPLLAILVSNVATTLTIAYFYSRKRGGLKKLLLTLSFKMLYHTAATVPGTRAIVQSQNEKMIKSVTKQVVGSFEGELQLNVIPETGLSKAMILETLKRWGQNDRSHWNNGKVSGCVYHGEEELSSFLAEAQSFYLLSNPLHPDVFPMVRKMEAEVVNMCVSLFRGDTSECCGTMTSGGTESILMAVRAAKLYAKSKKGIVEPNIVVAETVHAAFDKACDYFEIELIKVPVNPKTRQADVKAFEAAINSNTVLIVGSAPSFPNGCVDPITELGELALKKDIRLHVDCCLGSFLIAFARISGHPLPAFDFSVPGVTSISCDTHKYGFAPKGSSVIMYRSRELRQYQYFVSPDWTGGIYASPTIAGSRPGAVSVATWAAMAHIGVNGYMQITKSILDASAFIEQEIRNIPQLEIVGLRHLSVISFRTTAASKLNIFNVSDAMKSRGWHLNALQYPASLHMCVTHCNSSQAHQFVKDLRDAVIEVANARPGQFKDGSAAIYGLAESLPDKSLVDSLSRAFIDALFQMPESQQ